ncbi:MAG: hypothetical protein DVB29_03965 [Verrucomicrobia bacterium]|nr:MAG: hypothetical protein DVB29_03965 [Verrucomicrobiota bacterium]MDH4470503.1 hypothetical protein [Verrucomicrobiae bacterium]
MDTAPKFDVFLGECIHAPMSSQYVSALTRSLPLVSPFQGCLKAVSLPPVVPHQPLRPPRHDQYETSGLT